MLLHVDLWNTSSQWIIRHGNKISKFISIGMSTTRAIWWFVCVHKYWNCLLFDWYVWLSVTSASVYCADTPQLWELPLCQCSEGPESLPFIAIVNKVKKRSTRERNAKTIERLRIYMWFIDWNPSLNASCKMLADPGVCTMFRYTLSVHEHLVKKQKTTV